MARGPRPSPRAGPQMAARAARRRRRARRPRRARAMATGHRLRMRALSQGVAAPRLPAVGHERQQEQLARVPADDDWGGAHGALLALLCRGAERRHGRLPAAVRAASGARDPPRSHPRRPLVGRRRQARQARTAAAQALGHPRRRGPGGRGECAPHSFHRRGAQCATVGANGDDWRRCTRAPLCASHELEPRPRPPSRSLLTRLCSGRQTGSARRCACTTTRRCSRRATRPLRRACLCFVSSCLIRGATADPAPLTPLQK